MAFTARLPKLMDQELSRHAQKRRLHKSVLVEQIIREWLLRERTKEIDTGGAGGD